MNSIVINDFYRLIHTSGEYTFASSSKQTFTMTDHILHYSTHLEFIRTEIIQCLLSDHNGIKLEVNEEIKQHASNT